MVCGAVGPFEDDRMTRAQVEALRVDRAKRPPASPWPVDALIDTLLAVWDQLDAVDRFVGEIDVPPGGIADSDGYTAAYVAGYAAARRELRALRGIEA